MKAIAAAALAWGAGYLVWRWGSTGAGVPTLLFWPLLGAETFGVIALAGHVWLTWREPTVSEPEPASTANPVSVDVFVITHDEPVEVVEPTLVGCAAIRGPHTTYLLDDAGRDEMRALAARYGVRQVTRPGASHTMAGSIDHALTVTEGELILVLDAHHVPMPDILEATVGYFDDPTMALVQTPHEFSDRDVAQQRDARRHLHQLFYDVIAPNKDHHNSMYWCGSATVIRRLALRDVGGLRTKTAAGDFHSSIALHAAGWRTRYHPRVVAQGHAPMDLAELLRGRARWARGTLEVLRTRENPLWCPGLTIRQRLSYLGSLLPSFRGIQRFTLVTMLAMALASGRLPMHASLLTLALYWGPWAILAFTAATALARDNLAPFDSTRVDLLTMGVQIRAALALVWPKVRPYEGTPKDQTDERIPAALQMLPALTTGLVVLASATFVRLLAIAGIVHLPSPSGPALAVLLGLTAWASVSIAMVLEPLEPRQEPRGRRPRRQRPDRRRHHRLPVSGKVRVHGRSTTLEVLDISTNGLALLAPLAMNRGARFRLLTRLPDAKGRLRDVTLPVIVQSCRAVVLDTQTGPMTTFHVGTSFDDLSGDDRRIVLEYCAVAHPAQALGGLGAEPEQEPSQAAGWAEGEREGVSYVASAQS